MQPLQAAGPGRTDEAFLSDAILKRSLLVAAGWAWAAAIVWLSLTPSPPDTGFDQGDKAGHLVAYAGLMLWFCFLYARPGARAAYAAGFICLGIALEFAQGALGYRTFEGLDMVANALGVLLGWAAGIAGPRILRR